MKSKLTTNQVDALVGKVVVAKVLSITKHPDADKLWITQINFGGADTAQVVTAATNIKVDDLVPYLRPGEMVPGAYFADGTEFVLEERKMRGQMSAGMILAADEIGIGDDHDGILVLDSGNPGQPLAEVLAPDQVESIYEKAEAIRITPELQERIDLIQSVAANGGEIVGAAELAAILTSGEELYTYDGFEPSGQMHIAQGIIRAINVNKMIKAGFTFRMWVADWFGYLNNKMDGDIEKIKKVGEYFIEIWRASGMDLDNTEFLWTSNAIKDPSYWELVMQVARHNSLNRILRTTEIMGRSSSDSLSAAQIIYPCMQVADIFHVMKAQVVQLGMDQRKVNMLAREVGPDLGFWKPVVVSHGMLRGLQKQVKDADLQIDEAIKLQVNGEQEFELDNHKYHIQITYQTNLQVNIKSTQDEYDQTVTIEDGESKFHNLDRLAIRIDHINKDQVICTVAPSAEVSSARATSAKMSKSKPDTAIFMTDSATEVDRKIRAAYCAEGDIDDNPILDYCQQIIFEAHHLQGQEDLLKDGFVVERPEKFGGNVTYKTYQELEDAFASKELFPLDLKNATTKYINILLEPVRAHFDEDKQAAELLSLVQSYSITR